MNTIIILFTIIGISLSSSHHFIFNEACPTNNTVFHTLKREKFTSEDIISKLIEVGFVTIQNDKISFELPFDLHEMDCGAPDCYTTTIRFSIPNHKPFQFPQQINVKLEEEGCLDTLEKSEGTFILKEQTDLFVNYYSKDLQSNLIIKAGGKLYYYPHKMKNSVSVQQLHELYENSSLELEGEVVPYQISRLVLGNN
ncbi:hypothetical protein [Flammeovirga sp. SJP92]|uniref:hypothetical protein n=1 Tax=Flammeovirga sp. SJP92 TaxID=1775430 RepID=UPI00078940AB|nr:hypothetical protein [Flammeovirga sp. SJP92]KXX67851.1 hypothetical protein AVL50_25670 [Flammeovirga sp. SJP92]